MPSYRPPRILRIDPAFPPLWRDETTAQFGISRRAEVALDEPWQLRLLHELRTGIREDGFDVVAHAAGAPRLAARTFLAAVRPVLQLLPMLPPRVHVAPADPDDDAASAWLSHALGVEGLSVSDSARDAVLVRVVRGVAVAGHFARELADDAPHLPVAFDPGGCTVGPLVVPGRTACLSCRDLDLTARDAAWPRVHAQLIGHSGGPITAARAVTAARLIAELLTGHDPGFRMLRLEVDQARITDEVRFHEECRCRALADRSQPENARVHAVAAPPPEATRSTASARRA